MVDQLSIFLHSNCLKRLKILKIILDKLTSFQLLNFKISKISKNEIDKIVPSFIDKWWNS